MTKHDLKELAAMGAELGAAKAENEKLRGLLNEVQKLTKSQRMDSLVWSMHVGRINAALSQQAEPTDAFTAVDMINQSAQAFRDGQAATVKDCLTVQPMAYAVFAANGNVVCFSTRRDHPSLVALEADGHSVVSLAPIAQTAPQPEQSGLVGQVCGGDSQHNTVNVAVVGTVPWNDLPLGTPVRLIRAPALSAQGAGDAIA